MTPGHFPKRAQLNKNKL
jgi:hypothetical protein